MDIFKINILIYDNINLNKIIYFSINYLFLLKKIHIISRRKNRKNKIDYVIDFMHIYAIIQ